MSRSSPLTTVVLLFASLIAVAPVTAQAQLCLTTGLDTDGDNLCGSWETGCAASGKTRTDGNNADSDGDHIRDDFEVGASGAPASGVPAGPAVNSDGDGAGIDACDPDSDNDGIGDAIEAGDSDLATAPINSDGDGQPDYRDTDSDNDTILDATEGTANPDNDGLPSYRDPDDDGDGISTITEAG